MTKEEIIKELQSMPDGKDVFIYFDKEPYHISRVFIDTDGDIGITDE